MSESVQKGQRPNKRNYNKQSRPANKKPNTGGPQHAQKKYNKPPQAKQNNQGKPRPNRSEDNQGKPRSNRPEDHQGKPRPHRQDGDKKYNRRPRRKERVEVPAIPLFETYEDIKKDNEHIEKEVLLEITSIASKRLL